ncbi:MAG: sulfotransferase [Nocardioides sp.]
MSRLVLITGTGRSGTSTMAGMLHHLGLHVPGPYLQANPSNPKGFYESRWAMRFHKSITGAAGLNDFDGRPTALARAQAAITPEHREELIAFLRKRSKGHPQVVVKDPRSVWAQALWRDACAEAGLEIDFISMLRHPAEVVGSRTTYYASQTDEARRRRYEIFNVGRWVNSSLVNEHETRGDRRAFVPYLALLEDWRTVARRLAAELGLSYDHEIGDDAPSPVDEFIDPSLRRHAVTWDDLQVPEPLADIAEGVWQCLERLSESGGVDDRASAELDELSVRYQRLFDEAAAIGHDALEEARKDAYQEGLRDGRAEAPGEPPTSDESSGERPGHGLDQAKEAAGRSWRRARSWLSGQR